MFENKFEQIKLQTFMKNVKQAKYKAEVCNKELLDYQGKILSPNYPNTYPKSTECLITISVADVHVQLSLFFVEFALESSTACVNDYLQIESSPKLFGNLLPLPYFKQTNVLDIRFHTNEAIEGLFTFCKIHF